MKKLVLALVVLGCGGPAERAPSGPRVVLVFCDVTSSLDESQLTDVADSATQLIANLEPPVRFKVIPIMMQTEEASPIIDEDVSDLVTPSERQGYKEALKDLQGFLRGQLAQLYGKVNDPSADPDRSCIISALRRASSIMAEFDARAEFDVVLISDMIEECKQTPFGVPFRLNRPDIRTEIEKVSRVGKLPSLRQARIALILPSSNLTKVMQGKPPFQELRKFWGGVVLHAGLSPADLQDPKRFYFGSGLPERFRKGW